MLSVKTSVHRLVACCNGGMYLGVNNYGSDVFG
mgnify:FL=1